MKVVILCGGLGTRLREETEYRPKPMVEIGGYPVLWHIMKIYASAGFREFVLCLGYKGNMIKEYFLNYEAMNNDFTISLNSKESIAYHSTHNEQDFTVTLADTGLESMTGWRVKAIEKYIDTDTFMVTYGDGLIDMNIRELVSFHENHGQLATLTTVRPLSRFGTVRLDSQGSVKEFAEKPKVEDWISAGFFVFNRKIFNYIDDDISCVLEKRPLERLATEAQLMAYRHDGFFHAMDTYREYLKLNEMWANNEAPWKVW